jgi:LmbE family N-acetylglucosaminyl deacetylase
VDGGERVELGHARFPQAVGRWKLVRYQRNAASVIGRLGRGLLLDSGAPMNHPPLRLMAVMAHPDDETLGVGGSLARYAAEGVETFVVTATLGQRGRYHGQKDGPNHPGPEGLARIREAELRAATQVLGVRELMLLGFRDGELDQADPREAIGRIAAHVRRLRPHVVLTFGPEGAYGHPDHIAICQFTTAALVTAADPSYGEGPAAALPPHGVAKLYYMASTPDSWAAYQSAFKRLVSVVDGVEREAQPLPEWQITTVVDTRAVWPTVWKAVTCHDSQVGAYEKLKTLAPEHHEALWGRQHFYRVFSTVNGGRARETDLFEGLR